MARHDRLLPEWSLGQSHRLIDNNPEYRWDFPDFTIDLTSEPPAGWMITVKADQ